ncbi:RING finger protein 17 isoform X11 [Bubalus kerabau]|uniref:RING finger protein 17 isoform X11 n=1 Tax=Bubalus carabanensis TaxID=3119969 RepID=UPI00244F0225|nr:RING finger protein 17 isoform X11 [Bubalus carabanensis]
MAAEALRARRPVSSCGQVETHGRARGATEALCSRCGRRAPRALVGHHHELQCGHAFCDLCLLMTEEYSTITCPDCEVATTINTKQEYCPTDGCIKEDSFMEKLPPKKMRNCSQDFEKSAHQQTVSLEHSASTPRTVLNPSAVIEESKTVEEIDEALKIAGQNFEQLSIAVKMLEHIHSQTKEETVCLKEVLEKQFDQLFTSLDSRKKSLCEELVRNTDNYLSKIIVTKSYIEAKKSDLDAAMKIARELKSAPSLRIYCDLNQIIRTLKLTFESDLSQVSSLKLRNSPKLNMNCSEIICMFNRMGKIEFEDSTRVGDSHVRSEHIAKQHIVLNDLCLVLRKSEPYIEELLKDVQPLAHPCSLKDIVPQNSSEGWGEEAKIEFLKMVNKKAVLMKVFKEEDGVLIVDLQKPPTNKISSDMPVSLRDALVFMELARFRSQTPRSHSEKNTTLHYPPPVLPKEMTDVSVMVCHINSPSDFYLQLIESLDFLFLLKGIEEFYKSEDAENLEILCPVQDQACVAKFEDGVWYRAKVIGLPGHREVEVKYVDFGNTAKITLKDMRKIKDEFLNPAEKAIKCKLAYIEPYKGTVQWSKNAKEKFEEKTQDKFMTCSIIKILEDNVLLVELFDFLGAPGMIPTSINDQLVKEGLASYEVGYTLKDNSKKHIEVWDPSPEEIISNEVNNLINPLFAKSLPSEDLQSLYNKELPVHICNIVSPEKIYVQWLLTENLLHSLGEKMVAAYENSKWEPVKWENDMHCAVNIPDKNQWRRGQIIRMVTDTLVEVLLYDVGVELVVNINCLRELQENLKTMGRLSLECSLVDIRPTGGSDKWTATACDCLSLYLTGAVATIIIQENNTTWPLPVKIFCRDEKGERVDVSKYLIKKGLALRETRINKLDNSHSLSQKSLEIPQEQGESVVTKCIKINSDPDKKAAFGISEPKVTEFREKILEPRTTGCYKPPAIPNQKVFEAVVSCIGDDGTIFVVPKLSEFELIKMMDEIQSNLKCLGLLEPYFWKKGEACAVRGSDTMWYRGKVMEVIGSTIRVQYLDHGFTEKIPQCHLYPILLYPDTPQFCIPCQLYNTIPVGNVWQPDAVELLQELLSKREVEIHIMELPENPWEKLSIHLYFDGMSLSYFLAHHKYCTFEQSEEILKENPTDYNKKYEEERWEIRFEDLLLPETETPILPPYLSSSLPPPEELYAVQVKHVVSPSEVYICLDSVESCSLFNQHSDTEDSGVGWESESESLEEALRRFNKNMETFPPLTDFRTEMPCLAEYDDGLWYRAKIVSIKEFNPLAVLVQFVDYGSTEKLTVNRLRQIPLHLMQYPARAIKVLLAGFKPPLRDVGKSRIPYCPKWSMEALWAMIDCLQGKQLYASSMAQVPEQMVTLYEDKQYPIHMSLVEMGLADRDE